MLLTFVNVSLECSQKLPQSCSVSIIQDFSHNIDTLIESLQHARIGIAVSGGPDSLALVALTRQIYPKAKLLAMFVDHSLHSRGVTEDVDLVKERLHQLDVEGRFLSIKWTPEELAEMSKGHLQEETRNRRYAMMLEECVANNVKLMLTGHNLDDDLVTMLYRMSHASGIEGMAGMKLLSTFPIDHQLNERVILGHPLLGTNKSVLEETCRSLGLKWNEDKSNDDLAYRRNHIMDALLRLQSQGSFHIDELIEMQQLFKDARADLHTQVAKVFEKSISINQQQGSAILVLNNENAIRSTAVSTRVMGALIQFTSGHFVNIRTQRLVDMSRKIASAYLSHQEEQKKLTSILAAKYKGDFQNLQPFDLTKRVSSGQMTVGNSTFYPLSRSDALRRLTFINRLQNRNIEYGPTLLVQRIPPNRYKHDQLACGATQIELSPGQSYHWDGRFYLTFRLNSLEAAATPRPRRKFIISFMTKADLKLFDQLTRGKDRSIRKTIMSYAAITPASHLYQVPVIREVDDPEYMAFPTLKTATSEKYLWYFRYSGLASLISRFQCPP